MVHRVRISEHNVSHFFHDTFGRFVRFCAGVQERGNEGTREREVHQRLLSIRRGHAEESDDGWNIADRLIE